MLLLVCLLAPAQILCQEDQGAGGADGAGGMTLRECMENLTLKGDLLIRYSVLDLDNPVQDDETLDRIQTRFRVGFTWKSAGDDWELGAGLASGDLESTTTLDTWSEEDFFETGDIRLDYAYASHYLGPATFTAGQQINPFETSWLLWDADVRPAGFTLRVDPGAFFVTAGGYDVIQREEDFGILYAAQAGVEISAQGADITLAVAYYDFDSDFEREYRPNPDYEYNIVDLFAGADARLGDIGLTVYGQVFENIGAEGRAGEGVLGGGLDPEEENMGWAAGIEISLLRFTLEYTYAELGADAFVAGLTDATFGSGVGESDVKGHIISLDFDVTECFTVGGNVYIYEALERENEPEAVQYHAELTYLF